MICLVSCAVLSSGCGSAFPHPEWAQVDQADYVEVTSSPRPAPVEFVPPRPRKNALWVDGSWEYVGERYGWKSGTWAIIPSGLRRARWLLVRRKEDGQLFFSPSTWKDASGKTVDDSAWIHGLGPSARARSRIAEDGQGAPLMEAPPPPPPPMPIAPNASPQEGLPAAEVR